MRAIAGLVIAGLLAAAFAAAQPIESGKRRIGPSGLVVPRFVSLSAEKANLRSGPGRRYPILWVYQRKGLPLEVTAEYNHWRRIRARDGTEGWMHAALLSGARTAVVTGKPRPLRREPRAGAAVTIRAEPGVTGRLEACREDWCRMRLCGRSGWIRRGHIWGTYTGEIVE